MSHSNSTSTKNPRDNHSEDQEAESMDPSNNGYDSGQDEGELNLLLEQAEGWIKNNQTTAMIGGFGLGVFIGVLLRR